MSCARHPERGPAVDNRCHDGRSIRLQIGILSEESGASFPHRRRRLHCSFSLTMLAQTQRTAPRASSDCTYSCFSVGRISLPVVTRARPARSNRDQLEKHGDHRTGVYNAVSNPSFDKNRPGLERRRPTQLQPEMPVAIPTAGWEGHTLPC